ncbi:hypothetical protein [Nostoc sp. CCY0012]|uniref:hypothetical protein n=1 Tax=Nostoc sp. CCY0012 TaxID=1056123 RepID=UPI0039C5AA1D
MNENLYQASLKALTEAGVPEEVATKASQVVANDDAKLPKLGRTAEDQQAVDEALKHYRGGNNG